MTHLKVSIKGLLLLAMPAALSALLNNAYRVIDQFAVQWLGVEAQAAIASCTFVLIGFFALYSIISAGIIALIARAVGAGDRQRQKQLLGNALSGALLLGIVILTLSGTLAAQIAEWLGLQGKLAELAATYLRWHAMFCLPQAIIPVIDAIFIAYGRTKIVLLLQITAASLNFILNPLFIYFLDYGIAGAAIATGVSQSVALLLGLIKLLRMVRPERSCFLLDRTVIEIAFIGLPMCWGTLLFAGVYAGLLNWVISPLGPAVNAALGIGFSALEGFTWPVFWGFSMALASLVGRSIGAGELAHAQQAIRLAFKLLTCAGVLAGTIFWFGAEWLCGLFTEDPEVLSEAVLYAHVLAFSQLFVAYEALTEGVLNGAGKTKAILFWSAPLNVLRIPFCWLFAIHFGWGSAAVWWVINISTLIKAAGKGWVVAKGSWRGG